MKLNLNKSLIIFDLETTGLDVARDKIIQISYIKVTPEGEELRRNYYVNPGMAIPAEVTELTHITNEMVADAPTFKQLAPTLAADFEGCDFAGYNSNHFDIPLLSEELMRAGVAFDFTQCRLIDACVIYKTMERRNLAAAYKFYCGRKMEDDYEAHNAMGDTEATYRVLMGELDMYAPGKQEEPERQLNNDMEELHALCNKMKLVDFAGRMIWDPIKGPDGNPLLDAEGKERQQEYFNFGKYKGMAVVDVMRRDPGYISWMLGGDFTLDTKQALTRIRMREAKKNYS